MGDGSTTTAPLPLDMETSSDKDRGNEKETNEHGMVGTSDGKEQIEEPNVGMVFGSEKEVHCYYTNYARKKGFGVMTRTSKPGDDGKLKYFTLACARAGKTRSSAKNPFNRKPSTKTQCNAKIRATLCPDGTFTLTTIRLEHNHALSPENAQYFRFHKKLNQYAKRRSETNDQVENLTNTVKAGPLRLAVGDAEAICKFFSRMQNKDSSFFYVMDIDDECRVRNLFWADGRSRAAYEEFGDVVTFDTTYLANKYEIPLVTFIGVNHHGQPILLGCALLSNEDTNTFVWLFESWLDCMSRCHPKAIITDKCEAIRRAVEKVFPDTRHRWCLWDIMKNLPEKLSSQCDAIKTTLQNVVYDSSTACEFEEGWKEMVEKYSLHNNERLEFLYNERHRWVPAYVKDNFWAGMSIMQHGESLHAFFDGYVNFKTTLKQFFEQYDYALRCKVEKENQADYNSSNSRYECITNYDIEKQFQEVYTNVKFKEFQDELKGKIYCYPSLVEEQGLVSTYKIAEDVKIGNKWKDLFFNVCFTEAECEVQCKCRLFEFRGILCRHALAVLTQRKVKEVPTKYVLSRWRKDLKRKHTFVKSTYDDWSSKPDMQRYEKMCKEFSEVAAFASCFDEKCNIVMCFLCELKDKVLYHQPMAMCGSNQPTQDASIDVLNNEVNLNGIPKAIGRLRNSSPLRSKGRPTTRRKVAKISPGATPSSLVGDSHARLEFNHPNLSENQAQEVRGGSNPNMDLSQM